MNPERWHKLKDILESGLDVRAEQRAVYVEAACGDYAELRSEVESLLSAEGNADRFIKGPELTRRTFQDALKLGDPMVGRQIGSYRVERLLDYGGMGTVYSARSVGGDHGPIVAIKMVSSGMDTANVIKRFNQEQHILASLDHPNIARIYEGGTTDDGRPYFVMEYVEGQPIDVYCRERVLSTEERLRLFQQVCAAVDSAHQKLVVHRSIKPGNILVSRNG